MAGLNPQTAACTSQVGGPQPPRLWSRGTLSCFPVSNTITQNDLDMRRKAEILKYKDNSANLTKKQKWSQMVRGNGPLAKKVWANQNILGSNPNIYNLPLVADNILVCPFEWVLEQVYYGDNDNNQFGRSVSLNGSGTILAVGQTGSIENKVYVFTYNSINYSWNIDPSTIIDDPGPINPSINSFGVSVSLNNNGNILAVGAQYNTSTGKVYVYNNNGSWLTPLSSLYIFTNSSSSVGSLFGNSVSLNYDGSILAVGAPREASNNGRAYTYYTNVSSNSPLATFYNNLISNNYELGASVSIKGTNNILAVGAPFALNGLAFLFNNALVGSTSPDVTFGTFTGRSNFGRSVSLNNNNTLLAVGDPEKDSGKAYLFIKTNSVWNTNPDISFNIINGVNTDKFGLSVSLSGDGNTLAISAPYANSNLGIVYIYRTTNSTWSNVPFAILQNKDTNVTGFGFSVSLSDDGNTLAVGALDPPPHIKRGSVYIYKYKSLGENPVKCSPSTASDVPGPITTLCYNPNIPLVNYIVQRTYLAGGTKFPQTCWKPGDDGFPVGKAGNNGQ
jgi:hypothetical protein